MVRSTILCLVAFSISAVFSTSSPSTSSQLARRHHNVRSRSARSVKAKRCPSSTGSSDPSSGTGTGTGSDSASNSTTVTGTGSTGKNSTGSTGKHHHPTGSTGTNSTSTSTGTNSTSTNTGTNSTSGGYNNGGGSAGSSSSSAAVLPSGKAVAGWTLLSELPSDVQNVQTFSFDDSTFILKNAMKALSHPVQNGVMMIHYDQGAYDLQRSPPGGFSFYTPGPSKSGGTPAVDLAALNARTVSFGYSAQFEAGFQCNKGGKMPGLMGGTSWESAVTASGGVHPTDAWSTRMMFRPGCAGELYMYIPPAENRANLCGKMGITKCVGPDAGNGKTYGASVGTGNFNWMPGQWTSIRQVIHLNTPGQTDGWAKVYVNGASTPAISITDISFGGSGTKHWGQQMQSFFGGHEPDWASPQSQSLQLKDFSVFVLDTW